MADLGRALVDVCALLLMALGFTMAALFASWSLWSLVMLWVVVALLGLLLFIPAFDESR